MSGNPRNVRVSPGWLRIAPLESEEPTDLSTDWPQAWVPLGYTDQGTNFVFNSTFEDIVVAEEIDPIDVLQTARQVDVNVSAAELTAANLQAAFNGGEVTTPSGLVVFEPPAAGDATPVMVGWESTDGLERWIFRRCLQVGTVDIPRRRAPDKAIIPLTFRATTPPLDEYNEPVPLFKVIFAEDFEEVGS